MTATSKRTPGARAGFKTVVTDASSHSNTILLVEDGGSSGPGAGDALLRALSGWDGKLAAEFRRALRGSSQDIVEN